MQTATLKTLEQPVTMLKGVGPSKSKLLVRKGIHTIEDLLHHYPYNYEDRTTVKPINLLEHDETVCICATVFSAMTERRVNNITLHTLQLADETGRINAVWFNNKYIKNVFKRGEKYIFYGKIKVRGMQRQIQTPDYYRITDETQDLSLGFLPLYSLTEGLTQKQMRAMMKNALDLTDAVEEFLPQQVLESQQLCSIKFALNNIHFPKDKKHYELARKRLIFDEFFIYSLSLMLRKHTSKAQTAPAFENTGCLSEFTSGLPFSLTSAQEKVLAQIQSDIAKSSPMNRIVQGDVGSGKTVIAAGAMYIAWKNGCQSAMMAPTEVLAKQHYETLTSFFKQYGINTELLVGSLTKKQKDDATERIKQGVADIIVGTNAIIQDNVEYKNLGLVVTDEQHRFGVKQRAALTNKGISPHTLVMTATPIPRTMSLVIYGDLDVSVLDAMPPNRKKIKTYAFDSSMHERVYNFVKKSAAEGTQTYIVCPLVEESESMELKNVMDFSARLAENEFKNLRVGLMYGSMKTAEKDECMSAFIRGDIDVLISTTVIEVGVSVPNANIMIVENAERFGLSQLHQLRGRVGRGDKQAYCILFSDADSETGKKRMEVMCNSSDGFYISEQDFKIRGPGEVLGTRQHGLPQFKIGDIFNDRDLLITASAQAKEVITQTNGLSGTKYEYLKSKINNILQNGIIMN